MYLRASLTVLHDSCNNALGLLYVLTSVFVVFLQGGGGGMRGVEGCGGDGGAVVDIEQYGERHARYQQPSDGEGKYETAPRKEKK